MATKMQWAAASETTLHDGVRAQRADEHSELALIVDEITQAMGGRSTVLTLHPSSGKGAEILCAGSKYTEEKESLILTAAANFLAQAQDELPAWGCGLSEIGDETLLIPVEPISGHSRLVLTIFFSQTSSISRKHAENVYFARRPFAVGYFRLWQAERRSRRRVAELQATLNLTEIGVLMIDRTGQIAFANAAGEHILSQNDGLRRVGGALRTGNMSDGVRLQVALSNAMSTEASESRASRAGTAAIVAVTRTAAPPLMVSLLASAEEPIEPGDLAAIAFVVDPRIDTARLLEPVCRLYRLSRVETKLVSYLAQGKTLSDSSALMRIKDQTARSYMKQIFVKTSTNRQNELIVLMLSSVVRTRSGLIHTALEASKIPAD
jgi:DNA-binding CsgD family transcriptional regulator